MFGLSTSREIALEVHHAGSTSVPGLRAKPIIDIAGRAHHDEISYVPQLESVGYSLRLRETDVEHRLAPPWAQP